MEFWIALNDQKINLFLVKDIHGYWIFIDTNFETEVLNNLECYFQN
jgi:hypothetical protein